MASEFVNILVLAFFISPSFSDTNVTSPVIKSGDFYANLGQESKVTITIGEEPRYFYTINGHTESDQVIAIIGEYSAEIDGNATANIYMVVPSRIMSWRAYIWDNNYSILRVNIFTAFGRFEFKVNVPFPVNAERDMTTSLFNETSLLAFGPSRSYFFPSDNHHFSGEIIKSSKAEALAIAIVPEDDW